MEVNDFYGVSEIYSLIYDEIYFRDKEYYWLYSNNRKSIITCF